MVTFDHVVGKLISEEYPWSC